MSGLTDKKPTNYWAELASKTKLKHLQQEENVEQQTLVVFNLFDQEYALYIDEIKEIIPVPHITPIPQTPEYILGVGNIRGNALALLDLNRRVFQQSFGQHRYVVVLKGQNLKLGLIINRTPETVRIEKRQIDLSSSAVKSLSNEDDFIKGIVKRNNKMIFLLDIHKL